MQTLTAEFLGKEITFRWTITAWLMAMREVVEGIGFGAGKVSIKTDGTGEKFNCGHITTVAKDGKTVKCYVSRLKS